MQLKKNIYEQLIMQFTNTAKKFPGVYDLLLRGSAGNTNLNDKKIIPDWSDLDFSIIVEKIDSNIRHLTQNLYKKLKEVTDIKITITLVEKADFFGKYHCHGVRPIYYTYTLHDSVSLLNKTSPNTQQKAKINQIIKNNCFANISYLIHDLRKDYITLEDNQQTMAKFCQHLIKRSNHIIRNTIFLKTGHISNTISKDLYLEHFPQTDPNLPEKLETFRSQWQSIKSDISNIKQIIETVFDNVEVIYREAIIYFENINN